jgi:type IV conjugative transfer system coupling protein TraD
LEKLLQVLLTGEVEDLESYLKGTEGATLVSGKIEKTAISIRSIISTYLKSLRFLCGLKTPESGSFSIRQWLLNEKHSNWLFISADGENQAALRPLISMWMAMASLNILSLPENLDRRIWVICDEISSLHKLPLLPETIAEVRKFGGCFLLGMQSEAQMEKVYGRSAAKEIFDLLNTRFFFRSPSSDMAKLVSSELGEMEIEDPNENYSYGANSIRDGISMSRQRVVRPIVTYDEVIALKKMTCYVRLPENYPVTQLKLQYESRPIIAPHLLLRNIPHIPLVEKVAAESGAILPPETLKKKKKNTMLSKESAHVEKSFSTLNEQEPGFI